MDGACRAAGHPAFLSEFVGELRPLAGAERGVIHAAGRWADLREGEQWGGMSGAGLFSGAYLIGVVTEAMADRLIACPVSKLVEDASFREAFPDFRVDDTALWPEADRPAIRLLRPRAPRSTALDRPPSELLLAHNQVVPFDDELRGAELALLEKFSVDRGAGLLVFTGPGAGKEVLTAVPCPSTSVLQTSDKFITVPWIRTNVLDTERILVYGPSVRCLFFMLLGALLTSCYQGLPERQYARPIQLPTATSLDDVLAPLTPNVEVRAMIVEFEPGRVGRLVLSSPTQSREEILHDATKARQSLHQDLIENLADDSRMFDSEAWKNHRIARDLEMERLRESESIEISGNNLMLIGLFVDGPNDEITEYAHALGGDLR